MDYESNGEIVRLRCESQPACFVGEVSAKLIVVRCMSRKKTKSNPFSPRSEECVLRAGAVLPRSSAVGITAGALLPRSSACAQFPRSGALLPRPGALPPRSGEWPLRAGAVLPRSSAVGSIATSLGSVAYSLKRMATSVGSIATSPRSVAAGSLRRHGLHKRPHHAVWEHCYFAREQATVREHRINTQYTINASARRRQTTVREQPLDAKQKVSRDSLSFCWAQQT